MDTDPVRKIREFLARNKAAFARAAGELEGRHYTASARGGLVRAEVDHRARLVGIHIDRAAVARSRGGELGAYIVEAVGQARDEARAEYRRLIQAGVR
ncbi:YbaB/EbfC family nucleoid-associated protein [Amycolatopsis sp. NPDC057786]|uniref:YbaB/EbfC family nucleoid-associated protein n=1 Tax=Amycolatopsis sp. NPDC057786 TaxID=3346250 RepID=UPI00366ABD7C